MTTIENHTLFELNSCLVMCLVKRLFNLLYLCFHYLKVQGLKVQLAREYFRLTARWGRGGVGAFKKYILCQS